MERNAVRPAMVEWAEDWTWNSLWRWRHPTEHQEKPIFRPWPIPRPHDWVTRVNQALTKKIGKPCKLRSSEAAPSAQSHGKRQPPNNADSNPPFATEADRKRQSTTANPKLLDSFRFLCPTKFVHHRDNIGSVRLFPAPTIPHADSAFKTFCHEKGLARIPLIANDSASGMLPSSGFKFAAWD